MRRTATATWLLLTTIAVGFPTKAVSAQTEAGSRAPASLAEEVFLRGQKLFLEKRYEEALPLFEESYALRASPNSRLYVARCLVELGELYDAYEVYREVIVSVSDVEEPNRYAATQMAASEERASLRLRLATVRITLSEQPDGLRLRMDDRGLAQSDATTSYYADSGVLTIRVSAPGYHDVVQRIEARGGEVTEVFIVLAHSYPPLPPPAPAAIVREVRVEHPGDDWAWVSAGVGVVGLATWGIFGIQAERRYSRIEPRCDAGDCPIDQVEQGRKETLISNVGLGVGFAGFAGAGVLWVWSRSEDPTPSGERRRRGVTSPRGHVDVALRLAPGFVGAEGEF
jgi:hypothetical protein